MQSKEVRSRITNELQKTEDSAKFKSFVYWWAMVLTILVVVAVPVSRTPHQGIILTVLTLVGMFVGYQSAKWKGKYDAAKKDMNDYLAVGQYLHNGEEE